MTLGHRNEVIQWKVCGPIAFTAMKLHNNGKQMLYNSVLRYKHQNRGN